jgi:hypothetical protein
MCRGQQRRLKVMESTEDWLEEKEGVQGSRETIRNEQDFSLSWPVRTVRRLME